MLTVPNSISLCAYTEPGSNTTIFPVSMSTPTFLSQRSPLVELALVNI